MSPRKNENPLDFSNVSHVDKKPFRPYSSYKSFLFPDDAPWRMILARARRFVCLLLIALAASVATVADNQKSGLLTVRGVSKGKRVLIYLHVQTIPLWSKEELNSIEWQSMKSKHFVIYYTSMAKRDGKLVRIKETLEKQEEFAKQVGKAADKYYSTLADKLGYGNHKNLWTWGKRTDIYLFPDNAAYMQLAGRAKWSAGFADLKENKIGGYCWKDDDEFVNNVLPHELGHLMIREFVHFKDTVPLWLDEGIAQWCEKDKVLVARARATEWQLKKKLMTIQQLAAITHRRLKRKMTWNQADMWYLQCLSVVDFMIETYGSNSFKKFLLQIRDAKNLDEALRFAYPTTIRDQDKLNELWIEQVSKYEVPKGLEINVRL